jgi:membrane protein DedA with SNARE-associated domain
VPEWLVDLFARYGYLVVFFGVLLENAGLPVPGETALLAGAALVHSGRLSLVRVIVTGICGAVLGDNFGFLVGRRGGRALAERYGRHVGLTSQRLRQFDEFFARYGGRTVFIARFITGLRVFGAILAGTSGLRWPMFLFYNATGAIVWAIAVGVAGYLLGESWELLERWIGRSGLIGLAIVIVIALLAFNRARRSRT